MKVRITELAQQLGVSVNTLLQAKETKLTREDYSGNGKNTWLTPDGVRVLREALEIPELTPDRAAAVVLHEARNPNYVYAQLVGKEGKVPVCIPRRMQGRINGKRIVVEIITDTRGTSYRYVKS